MFKSPDQDSGHTTAGQEWAQHFQMSAISVTALLDCIFRLPVQQRKCIDGLKDTLGIVMIIL